MAQVSGLAILSVFLSVVGSEDLGNSTVPDYQVFNCSFPVRVNSISSQINLCSLNEDVFLTVVNNSSPIVTTSTAFGGNSPTIMNIHRYYCINLFNRITPVKPTDYSRINCPIYSMSCLMSDVTFECNANPGGNGVCIIDPQSTADSYGYQKRWHKYVYPPQSLSSMEDVKGATAVIMMRGGPCYYCSHTSLKLSTLIGFYCDERVTGKGMPKKMKDPTKSKPQVTLHWSTSSACYQFDPQPHTCQFTNFSKVCEHKAFICSSHRYSIPPSQNRAITHSTSSSTYIFGFCASHVKCRTADKNVMICKVIHESQTHQPLAYYSDSIEFIARPTGFVMQVRQKPGSSLKAIISFECSAWSSPISLAVLDNDDLPILLTLKHSCFCPDTKPCQEAETKLHSNLRLHILEILGGCLSGLLVLVICFLLIKYKKGRNRVHG